MMYAVPRFAAGVLLLLALVVVGRAEPELPDGADEILAVVNAKAITYQEIVADVDMQAEINAWRSIRRIPPGTPDSKIEAQLVEQRLQNYVVLELLEDEADRVQLNVTDTQMRAFLRREQRRLGIEPGDTRAWARYLKEKFNLSPSEYRDRKREEIRRSQMLDYMAGLYGALPKQWPIEIYFSLTVTPSEVRDRFEETAGDWRVATDIDYEQARVVFPSETSLTTKQKLYTAFTEAEKSMHQRVIQDESLQAASEGLRKLIEDLGEPGIELQLIERTEVADDTELTPLEYNMVRSVSASGGVTQVSDLREEDDEGASIEGFTFIKLHSRKDGIAREFEDAAVQESIRNELLNRRLMLNRAKVERSLLRKAAIVPERLFER